MQSAGNKFWLKPISNLSFLNGLKPVPIDEKHRTNGEKIFVYLCVSKILNKISINELPLLLRKNL